MSKILVFGASGQVGSALTKLLGSYCVSVDFPEADFTKPGSLTAILEKLRPAAVINAAAYTQVDKAEDEEALALAINAEAPGYLARWCAGRGIPFVHYSTDYVFPGIGERPWREDDATGPLNAYGRTKLAGEQQIVAAGGSWLNFRTSWVYDAYGKNFVKTMLKLGAEREELKVVNDQIGAPTYAPHLAEATLRALAHARRQKQFPSGHYHFCNRGETSWHGFALAIFEAARAKGLPLKVTKIEGIASKNYPTPARRPQNSRLSTEKAGRVLGTTLPDWRAGLAACMELIG